MCLLLWRSRTNSAARLQPLVSAVQVVSAYYLLWGKGITVAAYHNVYCRHLLCAVDTKASIVHVVCGTHTLLLTGVMGSMHAVLWR
jgi:hypothetical protein